MQDDERLVFTVLEASKLLHLSRNSVYQGVMANEIPHIKVGRRILIPKFALERLLNEAGKQGEAK